MSTYALTVFIIGLIVMAIMGLICGHYTLKLILFIEKEKKAKEEKERAAAQAAQSSAPANDTTQS